MPRKKTTTTETTGFTPEELVYVNKYPLTKFVAGSMRAAGEREQFPGKKTIAITCNHEGCGQERIICLQDAFHSSMCFQHIKASRAEAMKAKRLAKKATMDATATTPADDTTTAENATEGKRKPTKRAAKKGGAK